MTSIGQKIKSLRKEKGLTQDEFAVILSITRNYVCQIETDRKIPSFKMMFKIAETFGVSPREIAVGDEMSAKVNAEVSIEYVKGEIKRLQEILSSLEREVYSERDDRD